MKRNSVHFLVAIAALSLFILFLFFLEGEKKRKKESKGDKKCTEFRFIAADKGSILKFSLAHSVDRIIKKYISIWFWATKKGSNEFWEKAKIDFVLILYDTPKLSAESSVPKS